MLFFDRLLHKNKLLKIYLDLELEFYELDFGNLNINFVFNETDFYNKVVKGIPTYLQLEKSNKKTFEHFPDRDLTRLQKNQKYGIIEFKHLRSFSTKAVLTKSSLKLSSIKFKRNKNSNYSRKYYKDLYLHFFEKTRGFRICI